MQQSQPVGAEAFAYVARALQSEGSEQETLQRIVDLAPRLIANCEHAGITMVVNSKVTTPAATGPVPLAVDRIQYEANQGPCLDALRKHAVFVTDDLATETRWPDFASRAAAETGVRSMLSFRLFVEQNTLGSLNLYSGLPAAFGAEQTATGGAFAAHAAVALDSATHRRRAKVLAGELVTSEHRGDELEEQAAAALILQRSMLSVLPHVPGLDIVSRYRPSATKAQVGGDWYDAFPTPDGEMALVIGDVAGHDMGAAVQMAQLRNMLRSLALDRREPPSDVLARLDETITQFGIGEITTCVYGLLTHSSGRLDPKGGGSWTLRFANAGHPPPLLTTPKGSRYLETEEHVLLGLANDYARSDESLTMPAGAILLLYTDGLVERVGESLENGLARLQTTAESLASKSLDDFCDGLVATLEDDAMDDVCLLAVRV
ncbi:MAG TPA: GAF domain-containing SpoIIE family protein phosphatase [Actinomycetota bacterium]|nr:GAF domain-containing SpoIIE family protein phosphatase [Actinomycetota bacterium]